jgi:hypothetical protein
VATLHRGRPLLISAFQSLTIRIWPKGIYPDPEVSDTDLFAAISSQALAADVRLEFDVSEPNNPGSLERWDNEGGAIKKKATGPERREARRRTVNDTDGTRRRTKETKNRHRLV